MEKYQLVKRISVPARREFLIHCTWNTHKLNQNIDETSGSKDSIIGYF